MPKTSGVTVERLKEAIELMEAIAGDARLLEPLTDAEKARLKQAVSRVAHPDRTQRRKRRKEELREHRAARVQATEARRHETGIRALRRKPVVNTPNYFPPPAARGRRRDEAEAWRAGRRREAARARAWRRAQVGARVI